MHACAFYLLRTAVVPCPGHVKGGLILKERRTACSLGTNAHSSMIAPALNVAAYSTCISAYMPGLMNCTWHAPAVYVHLYIRPAYNDCSQSHYSALPGAESGGVLKDAIFDDVLALKQPSAMWPRPAAVGAPNARSNALRQRRLRCA